MVSKRSVVSALVLTLVFVSLFAGVFLAVWGEGGFSGGPAGCDGTPTEPNSKCYCDCAGTTCTYNSVANTCSASPSAATNCQWRTDSPSAPWTMCGTAPISVASPGCSGAPQMGQLCYCPSGVSCTSATPGQCQWASPPGTQGSTLCSGSIPSTCPVGCVQSIVNGLNSFGYLASGSSVTQQQYNGVIDAEPLDKATNTCLCRGDPAIAENCGYVNPTAAHDPTDPAYQGADYTTQCSVGGVPGLFWIFPGTSGCAGTSVTPGKPSSDGVCKGCTCCITSGFALATSHAPDNVCAAGPGCSANTEGKCVPNSAGVYCTMAENDGNKITCSRGSQYTAPAGTTGGYCSSTVKCTDGSLCVSGICMKSETTCTAANAATTCGTTMECRSPQASGEPIMCPSTASNCLCYPKASNYETCASPSVCTSDTSKFPGATPSTKDCVIMVVGSDVITGKCYTQAAIAASKPCGDKPESQICTDLKKASGASKDYALGTGYCDDDKTPPPYCVFKCVNGNGIERLCGEEGGQAPAAWTAVQPAPTKAEDLYCEGTNKVCYERANAAVTGPGPGAGGGTSSGSGTSTSSSSSSSSSTSSGGGNNTYKPEGTCLSTSTMTRNCTTLEYARQLVQKNESWAESEQPCARNDACCTVEEYNVKKTICMERLGNGTNGTYYLKLDIKVTPSTSDKRIKTGCEVTVNVTQNSSFDCYTDEALKVKRAGIDVTPVFFSEQTAMNPCRWTWKVPVSQDGIYNFSFWNGTQSINSTQYTALGSVSLTCPPANCDELCKANASYTPTKLGCGKESCGKYQMAHSKTCSSMGSCSTVTVKYCEADPTCQPEVLGSWDTINLAGTESFNLSLAANISGYTGSVTKMRFIIDNSVVSEDFGSPYAAMVGAYKAGTNHTYVATAVTADGNFSSVTYNIPIPPTIPSPTPKVLCPQNCSQYFECACNVTGCTDGGDVYIASNKMGSRMERRLNTTSQKFSFYPPFSGTQSVQAVCGENRASPILALEVLPTPLSVSVVGGSCGTPNKNACNLTIFSDKAVPFDMYVAGKASTGKGVAFSGLRRDAGTQGNLTVAFADLRYVGTSPHEITLFIYPRDANKDLPGAFIKAVYIGSVN